MGLLDSVIGSVLSGGGQAANPQAAVLNAIVGMLVGGGGNAAAGGGGLGGMLGSALGGAGGAAGGLGGMLGSALGGAGGGAGGLGGMLGKAVGGAMGGGAGGLGGMLGSALGNAMGGGAAPAQAQAGGIGLGGLLEAFTQHGMGDVAKSWVGTGQNMPVSHDQLTQVLGGDALSQMASQLGMNQGDLLGHLSQMLPQVVDKLTPQGNIPQGDVHGMGDLGSLLGGLLKQ
jgi:uncharacterized protein YidB (DUF937 family)